MPIPCSAVAGATNRFSIVVNATTVPIENTAEPCASVSPETR